mmetsp:Transcript_92170/g.154625  ORF Transcript_92170/g.154625 Transcript_92170/m.154625 type:complete len:205 (+) Transcript_92170:521-1135(+)
MSMEDLGLEALKHWASCTRASSSVQRLDASSCNCKRACTLASSSTHRSSAVSFASLSSFIRTARVAVLFTRTVFLTAAAFCANSIVHTDSVMLNAVGDTVASTIVLQLPCRYAARRRVILLSLDGTNVCPSDMLFRDLPSISNEWLIFLDSWNVPPTASVLLTRSLPARSVMVIMLSMSRSPTTHGSWVCATVTWRIKWDRELV